MATQSDLRQNLTTLAVVVGLLGVAINLIGQWVIFPYRLESLEASRKQTDRIIVEIISTAQNDHATIVQIKESVEWIKRSLEKKGVN